jgi:HPt (histidine-containing phosphotransfer) domain-containing protein
MANNGKSCDSASSNGAGSGQGRRQGLARLAVEYLRDLSQQLDKMRNSLQMEDYGAIKKDAHRIKGTSGTYQFERISQSAAHLERLAESRDSQAIANTIDEVMRQLEVETKKLKSEQLCPTSDSEGESNG